MASIKISIELQGFKEMANKLRHAFDEGDSFAGRPWRDAMREIGSLGADALRASSPIGGGATVNKVAFRVQAKPVPNYVVIRTTATRGGISYPRIQNYSPYAYQGRKRSASGKRISPRGTNRNRNFLERAMKRVEDGMEKILERTADAMEKKWAD